MKTIKRCIFAFLAFCALCALMPHAFAAPDQTLHIEDAEAFSAAPSIRTLEAQVVEIVNKERVKRGLAPLKHVADLSNTARAKSQDMIRHNYFSHTSPTYGSPFKMMEAFGIRYVAAGENIAKGQRTAQSVMNSWMNSPGHRNNLLSPIFTDIGVGIAEQSNGTYTWTQLFIKRK